MVVAGGSTSSNIIRTQCNYSVCTHSFAAVHVCTASSWVRLVNLRNGREQCPIDSRDGVFEPCGTTANWLGSSWKEDPREINWALAPMDPSKRYLIRTETLSVYDSCLISEIIYFTPLDRSEWSGVCWKEDP